MHFLLILLAVIGIITFVSFLGALVLFWLWKKDIAKLHDEGFFD